MKHIDLRPHNVKSYTEAKNFLNTSGRAAIVQATGTGKSYVIFKFIQDYRDKEKLLIAPSQDILTQFKENPYWDGHKIRCVSYQKLALMHKNNEITKKIFGNIDLIIADELHRTGASNWGASFKALIELYSKAKILGATATPIRHLDNYRDMVEELFHGNYAGNLSLDQAIAEGILPMPTYISSLYSITEEIQNRKNILDSVSRTKDNIVDELKKVRMEWEATSGVDKILSNHMNKIIQDKRSAKVVVFLSTISRVVAFEPEIIQWFSKAFPDYRIRTYAYHSKENNHEHKFEEFKKAKEHKTIEVLLVVSKLNEGVHIDELDAIIMLRKTESSIIYYQQIGRVLSLSGSRNPVVFDLVNNCNAVGNVTTFWRKVELDFKSKNKHVDKSIGVRIYVHEYAKNALKLFEEIDSKLKLPSEVYLEAIRRIVKQGGDINNLTDSKLQSFVRTVMSRSKNEDKYKNVAKVLRSLGARETEQYNVPWTKDEKEILTKMYGKHSLEEIASKLPNRAVGSVRSYIKIMQSAGKLGTIISDWTYEEDELIKKYYTIEGSKVALRIKNRTKNAVINRAARLGLKSGLRNIWDKKEDNIIRKYYASDPDKVFNEIKTRTRQQIISRASVLGVSNSALWTEEEDQILLKYYPTEGSDVRKRLNRGEQSVVNRAYKLGIKYESDKWSEEELDIIKKYYPLEGKKVVDRLPKRNPKSVEAKVFKLGLRVKR